MGGGAANCLFNTYRFLAALRSARQKTPDWTRVFAADLKRKQTLKECVGFVFVRAHVPSVCMKALWEWASSTGGICRARKVQLQRQSRAKFL